MWSKCLVESYSFNVQGLSFEATRDFYSNGSKVCVSPLLTVIVLFVQTLFIQINGHLALTCRSGGDTIARHYKLSSGFSSLLRLSGSVELQIGEMTSRFQTDSRTAGSMAQ